MRTEIFNALPKKEKKILVAITDVKAHNKVLSLQ